VLTAAFREKRQERAERWSHSVLCSAGTVVVRNIGSASVTFFDLTTVVDGSSSTDRITTTLGPGGDFWDGQSGASDVWSRSSHPLTDAAGEAGVRIRFVMVSDGSVQEDGFGVDDVSIDP